MNIPEAMDADSVRVWAGIIMDALRNPDKPRLMGHDWSFALLEHNMEFPDEVFNHPLVHDLRMWCMDMLCLGNMSCYRCLPYNAHG